MTEKHDQFPEDDKTVLAGESDSIDFEEGGEPELIEFSLDDLGRAYAQAIGLEPKSLTSGDNDSPNVDDPQDVSDADNGPCEVSPKSILEAILFMGSPSNEKLTSRKIATMMRDVSAKEVTALVKELNNDYENQSSAYRIEKDGKNLQLVLVEEMEPIRQKFYGQVREATLSQSSIDVLSIVAYNQPITREEVEKLRARPSGAILNQLNKRKLLETVDNPSQNRSKLYQTTDRFLDLFGLDSLADLPRAEPDYELQ